MNATPEQRMPEPAPKAGAETYSSSIEDAVNYTRWIVSAFRPYMGRRLMEVGLGHGGYRRYLPPLERYVGLDIDAQAVASARARGDGGEFIAADVTAPAVLEAVGEGSLDTILCVNVLEHIEDDAAAVQTMLRLLAPGGHLLIFVPALAALYSDLDRMAGHVRRYGRDELRALVDGPARVVELRYFNAVGGLGWWVNKFGRHRSLNDRAVNRQIELFDRFAVPVARAVDPLFSRVFGQSLVCVAVKP